MAGITANVQRTGEPDTDIVSGFTRAGRASTGYCWGLSSLGASKDGCVRVWIPWRMLSPSMSAHKIKGGMFGLFCRVGQIWIPRDSGWPQFPFTSMLPELSQDCVERVWHSQGSNYKKFVFSLTFGSFFLEFQHFFLMYWVNSHVALESSSTFNSFWNKNIVQFWNVQFIK